MLAFCKTSGHGDEKKEKKEKENAHSSSELILSSPHLNALRSFCLLFSPLTHLGTTLLPPQL